MDSSVLVWIARHQVHERCVLRVAFNQNSPATEEELSYIRIKHVQQFQSGTVIIVELCSLGSI